VCEELFLMAPGNGVPMTRDQILDSVQAWADGPAEGNWSLFVSRAPADTCSVEEHARGTLT